MEVGLSTFKLLVTREALKLRASLRTTVFNMTLAPTPFYGRL